MSVLAWIIIITAAILILFGILIVWLGNLMQEDFERNMRHI
jgi:hypothetical protein